MPAFEELAGRIDYPMLVVTAAAGGERAGCLVGFHTQTSIDPARVLLCLSDKNHTTRVAAAAGVLAVHLLPAGAHDLAELFGARTGDDADKFARCEWRDGPGGAPVLEGAAGWFAGRVLERIPLGDHVGYLVEPSGGEADRAGGGFLTFQAVRDMPPGHEA
jgi:flavin reductase (DIM6/NTAB) family NADH-FMN oxidoreductase RutF